MATRFQGTIVSANVGDTYVVSIDDADHVGSTTDVDLSRLEFSWKTEEDEIFSPIVTSECRITILIANATQAALISDMAGAAEGRFRVKITRAGTLYWVGYILSDLATKNHDRYPYEFDIRATDGIGRLKDIDYNNAGTAYSGKETILNHIYNVLGKIELDDFYSTETYLQTACDFWEESQSALTQSSGDPLALNRFKHKAYIITDKDGNQTFNNAYEVLEDIMTGIGARFMYSEGSYKVVQLPVYGENGAVYIRNYQKDKTQQADTTSVNLATWRDTVQDPGGDTLIILRGGQEKWFPALKKTKVTYKHFGGGNLLQGQSGSNVLALDATAEDVDQNNGVARLEFNGKLALSITFPGGFQEDYYYAGFIFTIKHNNQYWLKRVADINGGTFGYDAQGGNWVTTASNFQFWVQIYDLTSTGEFTGVAPVSWVSPELLTTGDLQVQFQFVTLYDPTGTALSPFTDFSITWSLTDVVLENYYNGIIEDKATGEEYTATNSNTGNSKDLEVETYIGTGPVLNASGALEADADAGGTWAQATGYEYPFGDGTFIDLGQIVANEMIAMQSVPAKRLLYTFYGDTQAHHKLRITLSGTDYDFIMLNGRMDAKTDTWDGEWVLVDRAASAPVVGNNPQIEIVNDRRVQPVINPAPPPISAPPFLPPTNYAQGVKQPVFDDQNTIADTNAAITAGDTLASVTVAPLKAPLSSGDEITLLNTSTGNSATLTVASDAAIGDTTIAVVDKEVSNDFPVGSIVTLTTPQVINKIPRRFKEVFSVNYVESVTVTENNGNLPSNPDYTDVYYNGAMLTPDVDYVENSALLMESGDNLLLESGDQILLDDGDIVFVTNGDRTNKWKANGTVIVTFWDGKNL